MSGGSDPASYDGLIDPAQFPFASREMDVLGLERAAAALRRIGGGIEERSAEIAASWQALRAGYEGPRQHEAYGLMAPVRDSGGRIEEDLRSASTRLEAYAETLGVLRVQLMDLERRARAFRASVAEGVWAPATEGVDFAGIDTAEWATIPWQQDTDTVVENKALLLEHAKLVEQITTASAECHNGLMDLVSWATDADDVVAVDAATLMDRRIEFPWGTPVAEERNADESVEHGVYAFGFNLYAGAAALLTGYDAELQEYREGYRAQAWSGLVDTVTSMAAAGAASFLSARAPGVLGLLPGQQQAWLAERNAVVASAGGELIGIDMQAHLAGEDGLWRWREDALATGTESVLNIGSMFVPSGAGATTLRTGALGARLLRVVTGGADFFIPGSSLLTYSGIRFFSGLKTSISRLDSGILFRPNGVGAALELVDDGTSVVVERPGAGDELPSTTGLDDAELGDAVELLDHGADVSATSLRADLESMWYSPRYPGVRSSVFPMGIDLDHAAGYASGDHRLPCIHPPSAPVDSYISGVDDGGWRAENRPLHRLSIQYQMQVTGTVPNANGDVPEYWRRTPSGGEVSYDGYVVRDGVGVFIETKRGWEGLAFHPTLPDMVAKMDQFVDQATAQVGGLPPKNGLEWHFSDPHGAAAVEVEFAANRRLRVVRVLYTPEL